MNSSLYNIVSVNQLTEILSHYDTNFVMSVLDNAIASRYNPNAVLTQPNVVAAWEQNFKQLLSEFEELPDSKVRIMQVRDDTYKEIIQRICSEFKLNFTIDDSIDLYSAAFYLYDFFVANFNTNLVTFFCNYIYKERVEIYEALDLASFKKNKDSSTVYGKKIYKDIRLAVINANIDRVIQYICSFDIRLSDIFATVFSQREIIYFMSTIVSDKEDFFKSFYVDVLNAAIRPILLTDIRLSIQNNAIEREVPDNVFEGNDNKSEENKGE